MSASGDTGAQSNETDFYELNRMTSKSREEFIREFEKYDKRNAKTFFFQFLTAIKNSIIEGDIDNLKRLSVTLDYISCTKNYKPILKDVFNDDVVNPLKNTNLIILACKHSDAAILQHLFSNSGTILKQLYSYSGVNISPDNEDETSHNAFYYAIRSRNVKLLNTLVDWPDNYFDAHMDDFDRVISTTYEELELKNVLLTDEIQFWVENKLISLRFFSDGPGKDQVTDLDNINQRIDLVLTDIDRLNGEYSNTDVDERFLFIAKFIVKNINVLKRKLKATYDRLPWEEIEFCLICFISTHITKQEINLFCDTLLPKEQLLCHLQNFAKELKKVYYRSESKRLLLKLPQVNRVKLITDMINKNPQFKELLNSYEQIRDIYSLLKINKYIHFAGQADLEERKGKLIIIRALQVTGEHLKNTLESPNMSNATTDYILLSVAKNTRKIISDLRNSLSHAESLFKRTEIEENSDASFFIGVQNDIKRIGEVILHILYSRKIDMIKCLFERIVASKNFDEMKQLLRVLNSSDLEQTTHEAFETNEHQILKKLIKQLYEKIPDKTIIEEELFHKMNNIIYLTDNKSKNMKNTYHFEFRILKFINIGMNWIHSHNNFFSVKFLAEQELENMDPVMDLHYLKEMAELAERLLSIVILRIYSKNLEEHSVIIDEIVRLAYGIFHVAAFRSNDIQWIEELREKLYQKRTRNAHTHNQSNLCDATREKYNTLLKSRQLELKNILNRNSLSDGSTKKISIYKDDEKLQAVVEMLILDIMSILDILDHKLENNYLFLEDNYPILIGKCLRNYLAHDNVFVSMLTIPSMAVLLNAIKLTENTLMTSNRKLGKLVSANPSKLRQKYDKDLEIITNQKRMFVAVEKGNEEELCVCFKAGSDIKARNITSWTSFHFAAKGRNVKILKFIHDQNPIVDVKDSSGQNPLHIAAASGRTDNAKYLIEEGCICVSDKDIFLNSPVHIAAMHGHKETLEFLLRNASEVEFMFDDLPLEFAIQNNHIEIVKFLLEENENYYKHKNRRGFVPLVEAAEGGHLEIVHLLLKKKVDVNAKNKIKTTPLHEASLNGHLAIARTLLLNNADVDAVDVEDCTPLHHAARYGHKEIVSILLQKGANPNAKHKLDGHTPLHLACQFGFLEIVKNLLKFQYKVNVNAEMSNKMTPIHSAAISGHLDVVDILLKHGAIITDERGKTPLFVAAENGQDKIAELLIERGAKIDAKGFNNLTPLHAAAISNYELTVKLLIEKKADITVQDDQENSILHIAVSCAETDMINFLIQNKASVNIKNVFGLTPLHMAARRGRKDIVDTLVRNNAQINDTSYSNCTPSPLHLAIDNGHLEVVYFLIDNGADIKAKRNYFIPTPLSSACIHNHKEIVDFLISKGVDVDEDDGKPLFLAVAAGCSDIVQYLTEKNARIDFQYIGGNTLLHFAARYGHKKIVNILIQRRTNINAVNDQNITPLYFAAQEGHADIVRIIVDERADVNVRSKEELSALVTATQAGHNDVVKILLNNCEMKDASYKTVLGRAVALGHTEIVKTLLQSKKIDVNAADNADCRVLHLAVQVTNLELVKVLVDYGFDINVTNSFGSKPIQFAATKGFKEAVEFFLNNGCNINDRAVFDQTLLHYAAKGNHLAIVQYLVDRGADVNATDINGLSSLHIAAKSCNKDIAKVLLKNGAAYNAVDKSDKKPLDMANDAVRRLLSVSDVFFKAVKNNNRREVERCIREGVVVDVKNHKSEAPLHYAAKKGYNRIVDILLENNANPNVVSKKGFTPLHYAVKFSHIKIVKALLSHGAIFNAVLDNGKIPIDLSTDEEISNLLKIVSELFQDIKNRDPVFMNKLNNIEDIDTKRAIMCACNVDQETLTLLAMKENLPETEQLKEMMQE